MEKLQYLGIESKSILCPIEWRTPFLSKNKKSIQYQANAAQKNFEGLVPNARNSTFSNRSLPESKVPYIFSGLVDLLTTSIFPEKGNEILNTVPHNLWR